MKSIYCPWSLWTPLQTLPSNFMTVWLDTNDSESVNHLMSRLDTSLVSSVPQSLSHLQMTATLPL